MKPTGGQGVDAMYERMKKEIEAAGYHFNPDVEMTKSLLEGLLVNEERYGYQSCPCRLSSGKEEEDRDIVCPCDYRDPDLDQFGACYCGLYVSGDILAGKKPLAPIPDRRPPEEARARKHADAHRTAGAFSGLSLPVWRCKVCGYLCARENPPELCPICKARKERFERFA